MRKFEWSRGLQIAEVCGQMSGMSAGVLYVVATPLGNLEDMSVRAVRVLKEVNLIAAEDTRHSRKLLTHFGITTHVTSYYDQVERERAPRLIERLRAGESIALISDAGTPGVADPGYRLVRAALDAGIRVVPIPGPSALIAALSVSGLATDRFVFEGFVPARGGERRRFYAELRSEPRTIVCYEAGRRVAASLLDLVSEMGDRQIVIARELTKLFEEFIRGGAAQLAAQIEGTPVRGEVTLLIEGCPQSVPGLSEDSLRAAIVRLRDEGLHLKEIARRLATDSGRSQRDIYQLGITLLGDR